MNLLFKRYQKFGAWFSLVPLRVGRGVVFRLHEEQRLINRYRLTKSPLVVSDPIDDLLRAVRPALVLSLITLSAVWFLLSFTTALWGAAFVLLTMTAVYFYTLREQIIVFDLLAGGRTFYCESIVALIQKEAYLEVVCSYLRQVLESAKQWDDRERIAIEPLKRVEAKQAVLHGSGFLSG